MSTITEAYKHYYSIGRYNLLTIEGNTENSLLKQLTKDLVIHPYAGSSAYALAGDANFELVYPADLVGTNSEVVIDSYTGWDEGNFTPADSVDGAKTLVVIVKTKDSLLPFGNMPIPQDYVIRFEYDMREKVQKLASDGISLEQVDNPSYGWLNINVATDNQIVIDPSAPNFGGYTSTDIDVQMSGSQYATIDGLVVDVPNQILRNPGELVEVYHREKIDLSSNGRIIRTRVPVKGQGFFNRRGTLNGQGKLDRNIGNTYPLSYRLTITDHGVSFYMHDGISYDTYDEYAWFNVQRLVKNDTGEAATSGKYPVHCLYSCSRPSIGYDEVPKFYADQFPTDENQNISTVYDIYGRKYDLSDSDALNDFTIVSPRDREDAEIDQYLSKRIYRFVVREYDIFKPWDIHKVATQHQIDSNAVINPLEQIAITQDNKFVITFPTGLTTQRFMYATEEVDQIAFTSAGIVASGSTISVDTYSPIRSGLTVDDNTFVNNSRKYMGMMSTLPNGNGMRLLVHVAGGNIPDAHTDQA